MTSVTIITACLATSADYIKECEASVNRLKNVTSLNIQWVLVWDGAVNGAPVETTADVVLVLRKQRGVATARNIALTAATGEYLINLDGDDEIDMAGVEEAIKVLEEETELGWVAANRVLTTGEKTVHWHGERDWEVGSVASEWSAPMAFHSNTCVMRTNLIRLVGGWGALGPCQDLFLTLKLSEISPGRSIESILIRYRSWDLQATKGATFREEQLLSYQFIEQSINAIRASYGRATISHPVPLGGLGANPVGQN